ncbi:MAG: hypothetical protein IPQ28_13465 [Sphingobacteriales bacterium]|nr:hypothetical protein [Sphingobacteriales bacterium]
MPTQFLQVTTALRRGLFNIQYEVGKTGAAGRSRFLLQLENELPQVAVTASNSQVKLQTILPQIKLSPPLPNLPPVRKWLKHEIMAKLHPL